MIALRQTILNLNFSNDIHGICIQEKKHVNSEQPKPKDGNLKTAKIDK